MSTGTDNLKPDESLRPLRRGDHVIVIERRLHFENIDEEVHSAVVTCLRPNERLALKFGRDRRCVVHRVAFTLSPLTPYGMICVDTKVPGLISILAPCRNFSDHGYVARERLNIVTAEVLSRLIGAHARSCRAQSFP